MTEIGTDGLTASEWFLRSFHNRATSATSRALGFGKSATGRTSYEQLASLVPRTSSNVTIVDLACGDGHLVPAIAARANSFDYIGIDISEQDLAVARQQHASDSVRFLHGRVQNLPLPDHSANVALCHMALMLFDELDAVAAQIARVVEPGGVFSAVIGAPALPDDGDAFALYVSMVREQPAGPERTSPRLGDARLRTSDGIESVFSADAGFETVRVDDDWLILDGTIEKVWSSLSLTYDVANYSDDDLAQFESRFRAEAFALRRPDGTIPFRIATRQITAVVRSQF